MTSRPEIRFDIEGFKGWKRIMYVKVAVFTGAIVFLLAGCLGVSDSAPFGGACLTGTSAVAAGANGSVYVQDDRGITHFSSAGKVLARLPSKKESFASDNSGNLYFVLGHYIVKASGTGKVLARYRAPGMQPEAVDSVGNIVAVLGGPTNASLNNVPVERLSPTGRVLSRWKSKYASAMAVGGDGFVYGNGGSNAGGDLVRMDPTTGRVLRLFPRAPGMSFDAVTAGTRGTIFVGIQDGGNPPFAIQWLTTSGSRYRFKTLNRAQELVSDLAVDRGGTMFVVRSGYSEADPSNTGLEVLDRSGNSLGRFGYCKK